MSEPLNLEAVKAYRAKYGGSPLEAALLAEVEDLRTEMATATQGLHDIRGILGFDNDGDKTPGAQIAGAKSIKRYVEQVIEDVREHRADDDEAGREHDAELARRVEQVAAVQDMHDAANEIDAALDGAA